MYIFSFLLGQREKKHEYFKMNWSTQKFFSLRIIFFVFTYMYFSNLLLSSEYLR